MPAVLPRDARALRHAMRRPYAGYAVDPLTETLERVGASVLILALMVAGGMLLGTVRR